MLVALVIFAALGIIGIIISIPHNRSVKNAAVMRSLTPVEARNLVLKHKSNFLGLFMLNSIDYQTASVISQFRGEILGLDGLHTIDASTAQALVGFRGKEIYLDGLQTVDYETAFNLARFSGQNIYLNGIITLDHETLSVLRTNPRIILPEGFKQYV